MVHRGDRKRGNEKLRVAFFAMFPEDNMATWTFCRWPVEHSGELGIHGRMCPPSSPDLHLRMNADELPLRKLRMLIYWYLIVLPRRIGQLLLTRRYDVALVQRGLLHPKSKPMLERLLARFGPPIAYHLDDALWVLKPRAYRRRIKLSRRVITGSGTVASYARDLGAQVSIVEYPVEVGRYPVRTHDDAESVAIGWVGARSQDYLLPVLPAVLDVCRETGARLKVVGGQSRPRLGAIDEFMDWEPWDPERKFLLLAGIDIGILPLQDTELHRGKEPFKLKEYMACGVPVVASPVGHVPKVMTEGQEGFFATDQAQWTERLLELAAQPQLRTRMGGRGRALIERSYGFDSQMAKLIPALVESAERR